MSEGLNSVTLFGNLGQEPELKFTQGGKAVLNIRMATTEVYFDKDRQKKEQTDWHTVVVWGPRAESLSKILHKGSTILVEGSIRNSSYEGRDGQKRYKSEVNAKKVILGPKPSGQAGYQQQHDPARQQHEDFTGGGGSPMDSEDIPFAP